MSSDHRVSAILGGVVVCLGVAVTQRYLADPSFWWDEASLALAVRDNQVWEVFFAPLAYGTQSAPRVFIGLTILLKEIFGYQTIVVRFLPYLAFLVSMLLWCWLIAKRLAGDWTAAVFVAVLFLGGHEWFIQASTFKQYSWDLLLALIPFLSSDRALEESLVEGRRRHRLVLLCLPLCLSFTYPTALLARLLGWAVHRGLTTRRWALEPLGLGILGVSAVVFGALIYANEYSHMSWAFFGSYWRTATPGLLFGEPGLLLGALGHALFGWYGDAYPVWLSVFIGISELVGLGVVLRKLLRRSTEGGEWASFPLSSVVLLGGFVLSGFVAQYPIGEPRFGLFAFPHVQLLALEGWLLLSGLSRRNRPLRWIVMSFLAISLLVGLQSMNSMRKENVRQDIKPFLSLFDAKVSDTVVVPFCSRVQVASLPGGLPVRHVVHYSRMFPWKALASRDRVFFLLVTENRTCQGEVERLMGRMKSVQLIEQATGIWLYRFELPDRDLSGSSGSSDWPGPPDPRGRSRD